MREGGSREGAGDEVEEGEEMDPEGELSLGFFLGSVC